MEIWYNIVMKNIHNTIMNTKTNDGGFDITKKVDLSGWFKVWFNPTSTLNILSFVDVSKHFRITIDTDKYLAICVHLNKTNTLEFLEITLEFIFRLHQFKVYLLIIF